MAGEAEAAHGIGLTPNHVSLIGMLFAILSALAYWRWQRHPALTILAPTFLLTSGFCDALDGAIARIYEKTTAFGGFLDSLLDRYAAAIVFIGIILGELCDPLWGLAALTGSLLVSYARARAEAEKVKMESVGIAERAERLVILALVSFLNVVWLDALRWAMAVLAILTNVTVLQRMVYFYKATRQNVGYGG